MEHKNKIKVYVAGPLYNDSERWFDERIAEVCDRLGFEVFLPHKDVGLMNESNGQYIYKKDLQGIIEADIIIGNLNGSDVDSGTAFEMGLGFGLGKYLLGVREDMRILEPNSEVNNMILESTYITHSLGELESVLKEYISNPLSREKYRKQSFKEIASSFQT